MALVITTDTGEKFIFNNATCTIIKQNRTLLLKETSTSVVLENIPITGNRRSRKPINVSKQPFKIELF